MSDTRIALLKSDTAVFDANGQAVVRLQNNGLSRWNVTLINVSTTSGAQTKCTVYRGEASARNQLDYTRTGNGDASPTNITIQPSEFITVLWTGGDVGATAVVNVEGDEILRGRRAY